MQIAAAIILTLVAMISVLITIAGLPGTWIMLLTALLAEAIIGDDLATPEMFSWWTLGVAGVLCILAEVAEAATGGAGAAAAGASKRAIFGGVVGGIIGAIIGTFVIPIPVIGTILGGAIGAGAVAMAMELSLHRDIRRSTSVFAVGKGAAVGRLLATVIKGIFAVAIALLLIGDAFF